MAPTPYEFQKVGSWALLEVIPEPRLVCVRRLATFDPFEGGLHRVFRMIFSFSERLL